ncbi:MAG: zinc ribbon domain-containing protein [Clostridia bacterium]|nr:zinc ribbon domain-containing protein [Clostridia bacterium]
MADNITSGLFNQFVKAARSTTTTVTKKTGEIVEATKLKVAIADVENEVDSLYTEIGRLVYKAFSENGEPSETINEKCAVISEKLKDIELLKIKLAGVKDSVMCGECGAGNAPGSQFCSSCGAKLQ